MWHTRTDPACCWHREPRTRLGWLLFNQARGRACSICATNRVWSIEELFPGVADYLDRTTQGKCNCAACEPVYPYMRVCQSCGNKRCPRAASHMNECTHSNEPGQAGSLYPV